MKGSGKIWFIAVAIATIMYLTVGVALASRLEVFVKDKVLIDRATIRLGDIATFNPANDPRVARLARLNLAPSPAPGTSTMINHDLIIYKLGPLLANQNDVKVRIPEALHVRRTARVITKDRLEEIFRNYVHKQAPWPVGDIKIKRFTAPNKVVLPKGNLRWTVRHQGRSHWVGPLSVTAIFWINGRPVTRIPMSGYLLVKRRFLSARKKISRGHVISAGDLTVIEKLTDSSSNRYLTRLNEAVGKQVIRTVLKGQLLTRSMIKDVPLVKRGQQVRILAENEHLKVTTLGKALQNGGAGDQVKVINVNSGKEILATVKAKGMVVVQF